MTNQPLADLQALYLQALRLGSGRQADRALQTALDQRLPVESLYLDIFQPSAYEIGRLWQRNEFSVGQEHLATAIIERQMGDLHPLFRPAQARPKTVVMGCVADERHRLGIRMVADFFELDGWTVHDLGADVPTATFAAMVRELHADLVGLSAQMVFHVPTIAELVSELDRIGLSGLPVMVGGLPFVQQPELYQALGVRFSAVDARQAVTKANQAVP